VVASVSVGATFVVPSHLGWSGGGVEKVRTERPQDYLKIVASVMPKRMEVEDVGPPRRAADLSDDELAAIVGRAKLTVV
jgi:hypothetical protein